MANWLTLVTDSLKVASESVQKLMSLREFIKHGDALGKLQAQILSAQQIASAAYARETDMTDEIRNLKARVTELETWDAEKKRYELHRLPPSMFVYSLKEAHALGEPHHYVCKTCYESGKKGILDQDENRNGLHHLTCNRCSAKLQIGRFVPPS
jgi:hypothetical protein